MKQELHKMKSLFFASVAAIVFATNSVHAQEPIYLSAGTAKLLHSEKTFKSVHVGDGGLLTTQIVTDHDLVIVANSPDGVLVGSANVLLLDDQGRLVDDLRVEVTPFGGPSATVAIIGWGNSGTTYYRCGNIPGGCVKSTAGKQRNGPDSVSTTQWSDGTSSATQTWHKQ